MNVCYRGGLAHLSGPWGEKGEGANRSNLSKGQTSAYPRLKGMKIEQTSRGHETINRRTYMSKGEGRKIWPLGVKGWGNRLDWGKKRGTCANDLKPRNSAFTQGNEIEIIRKSKDRE